MKLEEICPGNLIAKLLDENKLDEAKDIAKTEKISEPKFNIMRVQSIYYYYFSYNFLIFLDKLFKKYFILLYNINL